MNFCSVLSFYHLKWQIVRIKKWRHTPRFSFQIAFISKSSKIYCFSGICSITMQWNCTMFRTRMKPKTRLMQRINSGNHYKLSFDDCNIKLSVDSIVLNIHIHNYLNDNIYLFVLSSYLYFFPFFMSFFLIT